ncbi:putative holin [Pantoea sp. OXWO6B1]|uniref:putative holin n=1 Tax=Pantoea sp. OXWO6B1 TaxID=1835724 RepID=UPI0007C6CA1C|nr:putative holin [Pantoea sp. OXWO6B1]OAD98012.1 hypothetical protein A6A26_24010 [Pantoea sp. OXWO6B1]
MSLALSIHDDLSVIVASLSGALAYIITQRHFDRFRQSVAFFISFAMGIVGGDATLELIKIFFPGVFCDNRVIGAFLCSALIVTVIVNIMARINLVVENKIQQKDD